MIRSVSLPFLIIASVLISFTSQKAHSQDLPENERTVIALFGDSISAGENSNLTGPLNVGGSVTHQGCPSVYLTGILLNQAPRPNTVNCQTEGFSAPVYNGNDERRNAIVANWGLGGSSSSRGALRIRNNLTETRSQVVGRDYLVLIIYGTNDFNFGISTMTTRANMEAMINTARSAGVGYTPIIGLIPPRDDRSVAGYNQQIVAAAQARGAQVVDHFAIFNSFPGGFTQVVDQELFGENLIRLHPNDQGYLLLAETWFTQALQSRIPVVPDDNIVISPIISFLLDDN